MPGPESSSPFTGPVLTEHAGEAREFEIVLMRVPIEKMSEVTQYAKMAETRVTVTTGGYSKELATVAQFIHWVDFSKWSRYIELLFEE